MEEKKLYFMQDPAPGLVIAASGTPDAGAFRAIEVGDVAGLVAAGATIDPSAQPLIAAQAPEVATPGEGAPAADASGGTGTPAASGDESGNVDAGAAGGSSATPVQAAPSVSGTSALEPTLDASLADAGNGGASGAANTSGSVSGATAPDASSSAGTGAASTAPVADDKDAQIASLSAEVANLTGENKRLAALVDEKTVQIGELQSAETQPHPAKVHVTGLLRKLRSGEAIVLGDLEKGLTWLEEAL